MGIKDGAILGYRKIINNGPAPSRFNIVLLAEGFTDKNINEYFEHARVFVEKLFAIVPFTKMLPATNVYRIDVTSTDSGPDDPVSCGGSGKMSATYFDSSFRNAELRRLLTVNLHTVHAVVNKIIPQWHQVIVIVNSSDWGGSIGSIATTTVSTGWVNMAIHDLKQAAFGLVDESPSWDGIVLDAEQDDRIILNDGQYSGSANSEQGSIPENNFSVHNTLTQQGRNKFFKQLFFQHLRLNHDFWKG